MKCPKCQYLGFDTGRRCRNCGYDFSLVRLADEASTLGEASLRPGDPATRHSAGPHSGHAERPAKARHAEAPADAGYYMGTPADVLGGLDLPLHLPAAHESVPMAAQGRVARDRRRRTPEPGEMGDTPAAASLRDPVEALPLFDPEAGGDDEPLIKVPSPPRAPIAVRKTPELPRISRPPVPARRESPTRLAVPELSARESSGRSRAPLTEFERAAGRAPDACTARARILAAALDVTVLLSLHAIVVYFTLRTAGLALQEWKLLPPLPMLAFLVGLTIGYFAIFTAIGGQTIGKMAARIRVVTDTDTAVTPAHAVARALAASATVATLGAGFVPAIFGGGGAWHDHLAHTRVVAVRSPA